jgi:hypothetical protein
MNQNREKCSPEPWPNYDAQSLDIIIEKLLDRGYTWENGLWKALVEQLMFEVVNPLQTEIGDLREALSDLMDWQNGPPLPTYTKGWTAAMERAEALLTQNKQP